MLVEGDGTTFRRESLFRRLVSSLLPRQVLAGRRRFLGMTLGTGGGLAIATIGGCTTAQADGEGEPIRLEPDVALLTDRHIARYDDMNVAMQAIERALSAQIANALVAPPRHSVEFADRGSLVFTVGGATGDSSLAGFRVYDTFEAPEDARRTQVVAVWNSNTAELRGLVFGELLGQVRTGAIGGVAIRLMSRRDSRIAGVIGSGRQARTQLAAAAAARPLTEARVYSRSADNRGQFAQEMTARLGIPVRAVTSGQEAVEGADIVLIATTATRPVIEAGWLAPGAHVNTVGPKSRGEQELGLDVADAAALIASDSPEQAREYRPAFFLDGTRHMERMVTLAELWNRQHALEREPDSITLFCSVGLAGTEVFVADAIIAATSA
jgi:ornithine cyclodeaminase